MRWRRAPRRPLGTSPSAGHPWSAGRSPPLLLLPLPPPPPPLLLLLLLGTAALAPGAAAERAAPAGASVCYSSPPSVGSVQELARRAAVVIEGKVHPPRRQQGALDRKAAGEAGAGARDQPVQDSPPSQDPLPAVNWTLPTGGPEPSTDQPGDPAPYLVKVHQVWAVKAGGLKKDSLLTVRLDTWGHPAFPSCGRLKEDSRYIFFMEPDANSSGRAPPAFRASFPPLETGRNLKKEVSRVLCKRCGKCLAIPRLASGSPSTAAGCGLSHVRPSALRGERGGGCLAGATGRAISRRPQLSGLLLRVDSQVWSSVGLPKTFESLGVWFPKLIRNASVAFLGVGLLNLAVVRLLFVEFPCVVGLL